MINPMNPYLLAFNIWNKMDKSWHAKYTGSMSKRCSAEQLRTLSLDFGRRTGKTDFALHLLHSNPGNCVIVSPTQQLRDYTFCKYREDYQLPLIRNDFSGIVASNGYIEYASNFDLYSMYLERKGLYNQEYDLRTVDIIILDEPKNMGFGAINNIWNNAHNKAKFIMLGMPRI